MSSAASKLFVTDDGRNLWITFVLVSSLFLLWGFCNGMIDVMDKHFQDELQLSKAQSAWVQFAHYLGYFIMALPAGALATKLGYRAGIIVGLLVVAVGGFWFIAATWVAESAEVGRTSAGMAFIAFLFGVCVIASGLTFLETIANPYATALGSSRYAATRINLAQSCNGVGWVFGPIVGSLYFYSQNAAGESTGSETLYIPYVAVGIIAVILAAVFLLAPVPDLKAKDVRDQERSHARGNCATSIWRHPHFVGAVIAQFLYVAAQAGIFSFFINYMTADTPPVPSELKAAMSSMSAHMPGFTQNWLKGWFAYNTVGVLTLSDKGAANLASIGFICFLMGRFTGAFLLRRCAAHKVLGIYGLVNVLACAVVVLQLGWISAACVFATYFFMSIMFPTIFALGIYGLGISSKNASAYIVMAIMGGAILPKLMGHVADQYNMSIAFLIPLCCFTFVTIYGFSWKLLSGESNPM